MNGVQTKTCSFCGNPSDTFIGFKPSEGCELYGARVIICKGCHDKASKVFVVKYQKPKEVIETSADSAWSTATWDSD